MLMLVRLGLMVIMAQVALVMVMVSILIVMVMIVVVVNVMVMMSGVHARPSSPECCRWLDSRLIGSTLPYMGAPRGGAPYPRSPSWNTWK